MTLDDVADRYGRAVGTLPYGISVGDYPVDHHHDCCPQIGRYPSRPCRRFRCRWGDDPCRTDNLVVSDKAISVSNLINGSTRLQPVVLLTGQAAGTLAAIAARKGVRPRSSGAQVAGRPAGAGCVYRAVVRRETRRPRLRDVAAHRSDGHPAYDGRAVPVGRTARGSIPSAGSPSVSSAAACTTMRRRSKCPTTPRRLRRRRLPPCSARPVLPSLPTVRSP